MDGMNPKPMVPPWERFHPAMTAERLLAVGMLAVTTTDAVLAERGKKKGWALGCCRFEALLDALHEHGNGAWSPWMFMAGKRGTLVPDFRIGSKNEDVPLLRLFRPEARGQPARTLRKAKAEFESGQTSMFHNPFPSADGVIRLALLGDVTEPIEAVNLVRVSLKGEVDYFWPIWTADSAVTPISDAPRPEGVTFGEPAVGLPEDEQEAERRKARETQEGA